MQTFIPRLARLPSRSLSASLSVSLTACHRLAAPANLCTSASAADPSPSSSSSTSPVLTALASAPPTQPAVVDSTGTYSYASLLTTASQLASRLPPKRPVAVFLNPDVSFITTLLAAWRAAAPAVPLSPLYPVAALTPLLNTVTPSIVVSSTALRHHLPSTVAPILLVDDLPHDHFPSTPITAPTVPLQTSLSPPPSTERALIFFTSGTTGAPKGVVWTHDMLSFQLRTLSAAWRWSPNDRILNVLPLHHIHGLVNVVLSALYNHATLELHSAFDAHSVWAAFTRPDATSRPTVFMAVPAVYQRMIAYYDNVPAFSDRKRMSAAAAAMRLFVCGSAALPRADFEAWRRISGHIILERYGMTETGMTLSNSYDDRRNGLLGAPLPGLEVRLDNEPMGQLLVKGDGVFSEYWNKPEKTRDAFTQDGYFVTGDVVQRDEDSGYYRLLGRANADFIKTGGYKVAALEVDEVLRAVDGVQDVCVVGLPDDTLGERIVAAVVMSEGAPAPHEVGRMMRSVAEENLPRYKVPRQWFAMDSLPRNVMGKVQKPMVRTRLLAEGHHLELNIEH